MGVIPLVPAAVVFDLAEGEPGRRPGPEEGYAACEAAAGGVPARGRIGAGAGAAVGKVLGRERATPGGVGYAATRLAGGETLAAIAVANASGDVIGEDGEVLGGPHGDRGELLRSAELIRDMPQLPDWALPPGQSTTLVCVCTDAALDKRGCGIVARIASAGIARAVDPAFTPVRRRRRLLPGLGRAARRARARRLMVAHGPGHGRRDPHRGGDPGRGGSGF